MFSGGREVFPSIFIVYTLFVYILSENSSAQTGHVEKYKVKFALFGRVDIMQKSAFVRNDIMI